MDTLASPSDKQVPLYVRQATGLVRELRPLDAALMSLSFVSIPLGLLFLAQLGVTFPGVNDVAALILTAVFVAPALAVYALLAAIMPRSGGDLIFVGRVIHPFLGFVNNFAFVLGNLFASAFLLLFFTDFALPSLLQGIGLTTGSTGWDDAATWVTKDTPRFLITAGLIIVIIGLNIVGLRVVTRVFLPLMGALFAGLAITFVALLFYDRADFAAQLPGAGLDQIVPAAQKAGFEYGGTSSLSATLSAVALLISMPGLAFLWTYFGGEVRRTRTTSLVITLSSVVLSCGIVALIGWQADRVFGNEFQAAAYYLSSNGSSDYPLAAFPFVNVLFAVLTGSTVLSAIIGVAFAAGTLAAPFAGILMVTRGMFAYSFDRMLPAKLAEVNPRTHTPVNAIVVTGVLMTLFAAGFVYTSALFNDFIVALGVEICVVTMLTSLAGAILPYRRPDLYELSPTKRVVLGVPLITCLGVLGIIVYGVYLWVLLDQVPATTRGYLFVGGMYALGALIAIWAYFWHRRSGVQLYAALRDLPPE